MASLDMYARYSATQLATEASFIAWVKCPDADSNLFWKEYLQRYPAQAGVVAEARRLVEAIRVVNESMAEERVAATWSGIQERIHLLQRRSRMLYLRRWMAAAAVLLFLVFGLWFVVGRGGAEKPSVALAPKVEDIAPGGNKAVLTLADGTKVILDSANNGAITKQGNVTVIKLDDGRLAYNKEGAATQVLYNTITTPKGGQYQLVLADGTRVWLNAASSLRFPAAFAEKERRVELTGEGYFEVAHNAVMPFVVQRGEAEVKVLGTHFNINGYEDEPSLKITLLEGKVMVSNRDQTAVLKPGQQAQLQTTNSKLKITNQVDIDEVVAWKNGLFQFEQADIKTIMRQVARWYNVDVVFEGRVPDKKFDGKIYRNTSLKEVFGILEEGGGVHLKINGKKVIVSP